MVKTAVFGFLLLMSVPFDEGPLKTFDFSVLPREVKQIDLFLLMGQSNMKGRGDIPLKQIFEDRIAMMHMISDAWYYARHPLHFRGDPVTLKGNSNAGVGPGMTFAESFVAKNPKAFVGLIPCAVGGTSLAEWEKGTELYADAVRRARLAMAESAAVPVRLSGVLWLQGEADAQDSSTYQERLVQMIHDLRNDLDCPNLPFIAATIGNFVRYDSELREILNQKLLTLSQVCSYSACADARDLTGQIGDNLHYNTESANEIGRRMAEVYNLVTGR